MTPAERRAQMVAERRAGRTLESIGHEFGITRERVRQITATVLSEAERRTLAAQSFARRRTLHERKCLACGKPFRPRYAKHLHCSCKCGAATGHLSLITIDRDMPTLIEMRTNGATWKQVSDAIGWNAPECALTAWQRYARRTGLDPKSLMGWKGRGA